MPGLQHYTRTVVGKEATSGTPVAGSRVLYPDATGHFAVDPMLRFGEDANRGRKTHATYATSLGVAASIAFRSAPEQGIGFDELVIVGDSIKGGVTGSGGTAAKAWTFNDDQDSTSSQGSLTWEVGDDFMSWRFNYGQFARWRLSADIDGLTQMEGDVFARPDGGDLSTAVTSTMSNPTPTTPVRIPGKAWTVKFATSHAGLVPASAETLFLLGFDLDVTSGLVPRRYMDGTKVFAQSVEGADLDFVLSLDGEGVAAASTRYARWVNGEKEFVRLRANGPTLGSTTYAAQVDLAVLWTNVEPIASEQDGVNIWRFTGRAADDSTWDHSISLHLVNSVTQLPGL